MTLRLPGCVLVALGSSSAIVNHGNEARGSILCSGQNSQSAGIVAEQLLAPYRWHLRAT